MLLCMGRSVQTLIYHFRTCAYSISMYYGFVIQMNFLDVVCREWLMLMLWETCCATPDTHFNMNQIQNLLPISIVSIFAVLSLMHVIIYSCIDVWIQINK